MCTMRISVTSKKGKWETKNKSGNIESKIGNNITSFAGMNLNLFITDSAQYNLIPLSVLTEVFKNSLIC